VHLIIQLDVGLNLHVGHLGDSFDVLQLGTTKKSHHQNHIKDNTTTQQHHQNHIKDNTEQDNKKKEKERGRR